MVIPDRLFHYTSIETLALILSGRKIKFCSLSGVNDLKEGLSRDLGDFRKYIFVCCWTENIKESIPLWQMYTPQMCGVRIALPYPFFDMYKYRDKAILFSKDELIQDEYMIFPYLEPIIRVEYSDDNEKIRPGTYHSSEMFEGIEILKLAKYKEEMWSFEKEIRFGFVVHPLKHGAPYSFEEFINDKPDPPFTEHFIPFSEKSFEQMEITLGPKTSDSHSTIVESLVEKFNPKACVMKSKIEIR